MNLFNAANDEECHQLKVRISAGDVAAFHELFTVFFTPLVQFAFSLVNSKETAIEIVDDVFIRIWNKYTAIEKVENIRNYLYRAVKNTALNHLSRKIKRKINESLDEVDVQFQEVHDPETLMINKETLLKIQNAVSALPPRCKIIFKLIREDGLKYKDVAEILNLSVKTVDAQMAIAVSQIKERLKGDMIFPFKKNSEKK